MNIAFYGSSLLSSYWNGAATYYRGLLSALARLSHHITFYEPDAFDRQQHRDIEPPDWAHAVVYPATVNALRAVIAEAAQAEVVIKASGVGVFDDDLLRGVMQAARPDAVRVFLDVDAPATLDGLQRGNEPILRAVLPTLDLVLTYGGGPPAVNAYQALGARLCVPIYNALDPATHYPVSPDPELISDLSLLANRLPDREARIEEFFVRPAKMLPFRAFLLGGAGWPGHVFPDNLRAIGHVPTDLHNAFNCSARAVLNVARDSMAQIGYSPATRVFEAAGAAACIITDSWKGIELFLTPDEEILVARDGKDVADLLLALDDARAMAIGARARERVLAEHTYKSRAATMHRLLIEARARKQEGADSWASCGSPLLA